MFFFCDVPRKVSPVTMSLIYIFLEIDKGHPFAFLLTTRVPPLHLQKCNILGHPKIIFVPEGGGGLFLLFLKSEIFPYLRGGGIREEMVDNAVCFRENQHIIQNSFQ